VKAYLDEHNIEEQPEWGVPVPNQEAAYKSMSKYAKDVLPMTQKQITSMNLAWEMTDQHFGQYMQGARIKTVGEVVNDLDKSSSSGFPFNDKFPKKKDLFENDPEIMDFLEKDWDNLKNSEYAFCFTSSLKEEIRPAEKTLQNKIRTFTAGAVDGTVHGNRLFSDMNEKMNAGYLRSASGVGMSPMKGNWEKLYQKLNIFRHGYALDESEYDSSLRAYMMWGCARMRWNQYREEDKTPDNLQRLKVYYRNLINSLVITPEGVIVMKLGGNPSGSCNTINDNTLILYTLMAYAWVMLCDHVDEYTYTEFEINTSKILVGDDNTWTVSEKAHRFYNGRSVINVWKDIGVVTTTDSLEPRRAIDLDFLSAKTLLYKGKAIPVYDRTKLMTSLLYSETKSQSPAYTLLRAAALLQNGWSDTQFRRFCREFIAWMFEHFDDICYSDEDWIQAKSAILSDQRLESLYMGEVLYPQSYQEVQERLIKPDKRQMSTPVQGKKNRSRRGKGAKATRKPKVVVVQQQMAPKRSRKQGQKRVRRGQIPRSSGRMGGRMLAGKGSVRNQTTNRKQMCIEEDEYIAEVVGGATAANFNTTSYPVNIGQAITFPWASGVVGTRFEKYEFEYLEFYVKREVSEFATNGTTGKVMLSFDTDASDGPPTTKQQVEDTDPHVDGMPCENIRMVIPNHMLHKRNDAHYIRPGGLPGAADIKTYDLGNLFVSTQALASANAVVGELHVRYKCCVTIPILETALGAPQNNSVAQFVSAGEVATTATPLTIKFADVTVADGFGNGLGIVNALGVFTPPAGNYMVSFNILHVFTGSSTAVLARLGKNGAAIANGTGVVVDNYVANTNSEVTTSLSPLFVSANGTDNFNVAVTDTFSTGTDTVSGTVTFQAI